MVYTAITPNAVSCSADQLISRTTGSLAHDYTSATNFPRQDTLVSVTALCQADARKSSFPMPSCCDQVTERIGNLSFSSSPLCSFAAPLFLGAVPKSVPRKLPADEGGLEQGVGSVSQDRTDRARRKHFPCHLKRCVIYSCVACVCGANTSHSFQNTKASLGLKLILGTATVYW